MDDPALQATLVTHAFFIDLAGIRTNLVNRYSEIGIIADIPLFEQHVENFLAVTPFETDGTVCGALSGSGGGSGEDCFYTATFGKCMDGVARVVDCAVEQGVGSCACLENEIETTSFASPSCDVLPELSLDQMNTGCGWDITTDL